MINGEVFIQEWDSKSLKLIYREINTDSSSGIVFRMGHTDFVIRDDPDGDGLLVTADEQMIISPNDANSIVLEVL